MSEKFSTAVEKLWIPGTIVSKIFNTTSTGQNFVLIINKVWWFKVRLFTEVGDDCPGCEVPGVRLIQTSQHCSLKGAEKEAAEWANGLTGAKIILPFTVPVQDYDFDNEMVASDIYGKYYPIYAMSKNFSVKYISEKDFDDCRKNPEKYFKPGDHLIIERYFGLYHHDGIYIGNENKNEKGNENKNEKGNEKVIHYNNPPSTSGKRKAVVHKGDWKDFLVHKGNWKDFFGGRIGVVHYFVRFRKADEIVDAARDYACTCWGEEMYNLFGNNCQHFACKCATDIEFSSESNWITDRFSIPNAIGALHYKTV